MASVTAIGSDVCGECVEGIKVSVKLRITGGLRPCTNKAKEALGNKAVKRSLHSDLFQVDVLGAD
jgi:hypothetical protein